MFIEDLLPLIISGT